VFLVAMPVLSRIVDSARGPLRSNDHLQHIGLAQDMAHGRSIPPHPLFHVFLIALMGGDNRPSAEGLLAFLLAFALGVRAWLTARLLLDVRSLSTVAVTLLCLLLALAMPFPNWWGGDIYQGNVSPNVWHNPTGIFAMPFAVGLFLLGARELDQPSVRAASVTGLVMFLSLLAKPNFVLAFGPCLAVALLGAVTARNTAKSVTAGAAVYALTFAPALVVFAVQSALLTRNEQILYAPFAVWGVYCHEHYVGAVLIGIAFPLTVLACYPRAVNASRPLVLAWATLAVAIATFALFAESGERITHANFAWGMTLADHVLFVLSTAFVLQQRGIVRRAVCLGVLGLHALSGAAALRTYCG
jgi:hypothetical protein